MLLGVALGRKTQQIAAEMRRSPKTIEKHRASVQRKLGLNTVAQFTSHAISHGLLSTDQVLAHDGSRSNAAPVRRLALLSAQQTGKVNIQSDAVSKILQLLNQLWIKN